MTLGELNAQAQEWGMDDDTELTARGFTGLKKLIVFRGYTHKGQHRLELMKCGSAVRIDWPGDLLERKPNILT